jgi:hypothetical protein
VRCGRGFLDIQGLRVLDLNREGGLSPKGFLRAA